MRTAWITLAVLLLGCPGGNITTTNAPPNATILQPIDAAVVSATVPLVLAGVVGDTGTEAAELRVTWSSDLMGELFDGPPDDSAGNTTVTVNAPEIGDHAITLTVLDPAGASASTTITVIVQGDTPPTCEIGAPEQGVVNAAEVVQFEGLVADAEDAAEDLQIRWSSQADGVFGEDPPSGAGAVFASTTLSPGDHEITLLVTDSSGLECLALLDLQVDEPPSAPVVTLAPDPPTTLDDLSAAIVDGVDPEGGVVTQTISWTVDGADAGLTGTVVPSAELDEGEVWAISVVATDEEGLESAPATASVTVANAPPSAPVITIDPAAPTQAEDLVCAVDVPATDADGDTVSLSYAWELDGAPTSFTGDTLDWLETEVGDLWTCVATPHDGDVAGPSGDDTVQIAAGCASITVPAGGEVAVPDMTPLRLAGGDFTIEAWVHLASSGTIASKAASSGGWQLAVSVGTVVADVGGTQLVATNAVPANQWTHVAATFDSGSGLMTLWADGANVGSGAVTQPGATLTDPLLLGADGSGGGFDGSLDDVRLSSVVRYSAPFVPASQLGADANTIAWWGFEEAGGSDAKDLSGGGHDGVVSAPAVFDTSESTCSNDQAPTAPVVEVTPEYPLLSEDLTCALLTPSVDPEGATVTYQGTWLVDGAPSGQTFVAFPATLASALTSEGEEWTCSVTASDGGQLGPAGTDSVFTGAMLIGTLVVADPANAAGTNIPFTPPLAGIVRATMDNPDASRDGVFTIDTLGFGVTWLFTGYRDWAYLGATVAGWASTDVEFNLDPSLGTVTFDIDYDPTAGIDNTGPDTLTLEFVYGDTLSTTGATFVVGSDVGPQDTTLAQTTATFAAGERLLFETVQCGFGGGAHGVYADGDNQPNNDGIARIDTGFSGDCQIPLESRPIGAGTWNLTLANEDDFFSDNTDQREVSVYRYTP